MAPPPRIVTLLTLAGLAAVSIASAAPQSVDDAVHEIRAALDGGRLAEASAAAEQAASRYPESPQVAVWAAHAYRHAGNLAAAASAYARAEALSPDDPEVAMGRGALYENVGDLPAATAAYDRAIELASEIAAPWRAAGSVYLRLGDHPRAAEYFRGSLERQTDDPSVRYLLGVALYLSGDYDASVEVLEVALQQDPSNVPAGYTLGVILADRPPQHDRALDLLRRAAAAGFEEIEASYLMGRILADGGDFEQSIAHLRRTIDLEPRHMEATYRLAQALSRTGGTEEGQRLMERFGKLQQDFNAREASDKELKTLSNALAAAMTAANGAEVDRVLTAMLAAAPENPDVLLRAAKVWLSSNKIEAAINAATAAAQIDPDNWEALYLQGLGLERAGQAAQAVQPLRGALQRNPLFVDTYAVLGNALLTLGETKAALSAYLAATDLDAENPVYWLNLATAYQTLEQTRLAEQAMDEYRRLSDQRSSERP
ncbi:MAG TPA: tetratricopeptide repeat protein [Acidobacteriota bacterium]|nr:tetratricopeptide repeat protein [Acidobacteriota bacterium]